MWEKPTVWKKNKKTTKANEWKSCYCLSLPLKSSIASFIITYRCMSLIQCDRAYCEPRRGKTRRLPAENERKIGKRETSWAKLRWGYRRWIQSLISFNVVFFSKLCLPVSELCLSVSAPNLGSRIFDLFIKPYGFFVKIFFKN